MSNPRNPHDPTVSEGTAELFDADADWLDHELGTVVALQQEGVMLWVFLWQHKGLFCFPVVEVGEIDTAEVSVIAATGNHDPMSVARP